MRREAIGPEDAVSETSMPGGHAEGGVAPATDGRGPASGRQPYEKPCFHTIDLAAEEVLAVGCKLDGGPGGPIGASCTASSCFSAGS